MERMLFCFHVNVWDQRLPLDRIRTRYGHTHLFHEFFYCLNSRGHQLAEDRSFASQKGDLFFFPAGQLHCANGAGGQVQKGIVANFSDDLFCGDAFMDRHAREVLDVLLRLAQQGRNRIPLETETRRDLTDLLAALSREFTDKQPAYEETARTLLHTALLRILRDPRVRPLMPRPNRAASGHREQVWNVLRHLRSHYMDPVRVEDMTRLAGLSRSHFHSVFRKETGKTLTQMVTETRLEVAQRMLRETDTPVLQVALECGFQSPSHFHNLFQTHTGLTPRRYRLRTAAGQPQPE